MNKLFPRFSFDILDVLVSVQVFHSEKLYASILTILLYKYK